MPMVQESSSPSPFIPFLLSFHNMLGTYLFFNLPIPFTAYSQNNKSMTNWFQVTYKSTKAPLYFAMSLLIVF
jgi:hypothetical protein